MISTRQNDPIETLQSNFLHMPSASGQEKSGYLWQFKATLLNPNGGNLHEFVLKPEFNNLAKFVQSENASKKEMGQFSFKQIQSRVNEKESEMYPALEEIWYVLIELIEGVTSKEYESMKLRASGFDDTLPPPPNGKSWQNYYEVHFKPISEQLFQLGFQMRCSEDCEEVTLTLPNHEALLSNWDELRSKNPLLPTLKIRASSGIATDKEFLDAFLNGEFIVSTEGEFVHDMTAHLYRFIKRILMEEHYKRYVKFDTMSLLDTQRTRLSALLDIIRLVTETLPQDQKSKFDPIVNILSQNVDILLGFNEEDLRPKKFHLLRINDTILETLNKATKTTYSEEDIKELVAELIEIYSEKVDPDQSLSVGTIKSGDFWKFESRLINPKGGFLYKFSLDPKFNNLKKYIDDESKVEMDQSTFLRIQANQENVCKIKRPALEEIWTPFLPLKMGLSSIEHETIISLCNEFDPSPFLLDLENPFIKAKFDCFRELGYQFDYDNDRKFVTLVLPDDEALLFNWKQLQSRYPMLPNLKILPTSGISSDREFIKAFLDGNFVLSNDDEFIHDNTVHLFRYINLVLNDAVENEPIQIDEDLEILREQLKDVFQKIEHAVHFLPEDQKGLYDPLINILSRNLDFFVAFQRNDIGAFLDKSPLPIIFPSSMANLNDDLDGAYTKEEIVALFESIGIVPSLDRLGGE